MRGWKERRRGRKRSGRRRGDERVNKREKRRRKKRRGERERKRVVKGKRSGGGREKREGRGGRVAARKRE